jgi:hypothetical protein
MKQHPPIVRNLHGACVPYSVANAVHFIVDPQTGENLAKRMLSFYPPFSEGYLVAEVDGMLKIADPDGELLANILYFQRTVNSDFTNIKFLTKAQFYEMARLWDLSEVIKSQYKEKEYFTTFIFYVLKNGVPHAVSGYISLDNFTLILMDSAGAGSVELFELEQFFKAFKVYGVVQVGVELEKLNPQTNGIQVSRIPYIIERETIELWK